MFKFILILLFLVNGTWTNYGEGWPGSHGFIPDFLPANPSDNPNICTTFEVFLENTWGQDTNVVLFTGQQRAYIETAWDGHLLLEPIYIYPFILNSAGALLDFDIPCDLSLIGQNFDLQVLQIDPGASQGISFTQGLELLIGN